MRRFVISLTISIMVLGAIIAVIFAFEWGQSQQCNHYRDQGGPQWAIDKYCGPEGR